MDASKSFPSNYDENQLPENQMNFCDENSLKVLEDIRRKCLFCDAVLKLTCGSKFLAHKLTLSKHSKYFMSLFLTEDMFESHERENGMTVVNLQWVTKNLIERVLEYVKKGKDILTSQNIYETLVAADFFVMEGAVRECLQFITSTLAIENCVYFYNHLKPFILTDACEIIKQFISDHFEDIIKNNADIFQLDIEDMTSICSSDFLNIRDEKILWYFLAKWIDAKKEKKLRSAFALLKSVRLGLIDKNILRRKILTHPYVRANYKKCSPLVKRAIVFRKNVATIHLSNNEVCTPSFARPRISKDVIVAQGGWNEQTPCSVIEMYDIKADRWIKVRRNPDGQLRRAYHGSAFISNKIYFVGGQNGRKYLSTCCAFDILSKKWNPVSSMSSIRCYVNVALLDGCIYAMGGSDGLDRLNTVEMYDPSKDEWSPVTSMNCCRSDADAAVLNGKIYIVGGFTGENYLDSVEVFDPAHPDHWLMTTPMLTRRSGCSCVAHNGFLYVAGGFTGRMRLKSLERYDPKTGQWHLLAKMKTSRSNFSMEVIGQHLFAIGGFSQGNTTSRVECYDIKKNRWFQATSMNISRSALTTCVIRDMPDFQHYMFHKRDRVMEDKRLCVKQLLSADFRDVLNSENYPQLQNYNES